MKPGTDTKALFVRTERARKNLTFKLILQARFEPELRKYFNSISRRFINHFRFTGSILPVDNFHEDTVNILKKQYTRVSKAFSDEMRSSVKKKSIDKIETKQEEDEEAVSELIDEALFIFIIISSARRSIFLDQTTEKNMVSAIASATKTLKEQGLPVTNERIIPLAKKDINKSFRGRIETISLTETQFAAERTKAIEANAIAGGPRTNISNVVDVEGIEDFETRKEWASVLAQNTRDNHAIADGQEKELSEPFIVGGEFLKHPGDSSLGASIGNTANCQCSALYT